MIKLYRAYSRIADFHESSAVPVCWFCYQREGQVAPYEELIQGYQHLSEEERLHAEEAANELLTEAEAGELRGYLAERDGPEFELGEVVLPMEAHVTPLGAIPVGGPQGFIRLFERADYQLSIPICGYYDLRAAASGPFSEIEVEPITEPTERAIEDFLSSRR